MASSRRHGQVRCEPLVREVEYSEKEVPLDLFLPAEWLLDDDSPIFSEPSPHPSRVRAKTPS